MLASIEREVQGKIRLGGLGTVEGMKGERNGSQRLAWFQSWKIDVLQVRAHGDVEPEVGMKKRVQAKIEDHGEETLVERNTGEEDRIGQRFSGRGGSVEDKAEVECAVGDGGIGTQVSLIGEGGGAGGAGITECEGEAGPEERGEEGNESGWERVHKREWEWHSMIGGWIGGVHADWFE
jgi:hypothetical protein